MTAADNRAALVATVLGGHSSWPDYLDGCRGCGWKPDGNSFCGVQHAAHVASEVVAALEAGGYLLMGTVCGDWPAPCNHDPHHERTER